MPYPIKRYPVDGRMMTLQEVADMLGISRESLSEQKCRRKCDPQTIVNLHRAGLILTRECGPKYWFRGRLRTLRECAELLGVTVRTIYSWQVRHPREDGSRPSVQEALAAYQVRQRPRLHWIGDRLLTVAQVAAEAGVTAKTFRGCMAYHDFTAAEALAYYRQRGKRAEVRAREAEAKKAAAAKRAVERAAMKQAERDILSILGF